HPLVPPPAGRQGLVRPRVRRRDISRARRGLASAVPWPCPAAGIASPPHFERQRSCQAGGTTASWGGTANAEGAFGAGSDEGEMGAKASSTRARSYPCAASVARRAARLSPVP